MKTLPKSEKEEGIRQKGIGYSLPNRDSAGPRYGKHDQPEEVAECVTECWGHLDKLKNLDEFRELVRSNKWQFAKTMPQNPHWYTLRKTWVREEEFIQFTQYIRDNGSLEWFWGMSYRKLICDGFKYWSSVGLAGGVGCKGCTGKHCRCSTTYGVGDPLDITTLVNRAEHPSPVFDELGNRLSNSVAKKPL